MNLASPILISHKSEDFRSLLREMLTKHGFFHLLEAANVNEVIHHLNREKKNVFTFIQEEILDEEIINTLSDKKHFVILAQSESERMITLASRLGIQHFLSFPFSSTHLLNKITQISQ